MNLDGIEKRIEGWRVMYPAYPVDAVSTAKELVAEIKRLRNSIANLVTIAGGEPTGDTSADIHFLVEALDD